MSVVFMQNAFEIPDASRW